MKKGLLLPHQWSCLLGHFTRRVQFGSRELLQTTTWQTGVSQEARVPKQPEQLMARSLETLPWINQRSTLSLRMICLEIFSNGILASSIRAIRKAGQRSCPRPREKKIKSLYVHYTHRTKFSFHIKNHENILYQHLITLRRTLRLSSAI